MKFSVSAVLAFAAAVLAQPVLLNSNYQITEGEPFTLKWDKAQGPVTITLMTGDSKNLKEVTVLTSKPRPPRCCLDLIMVLTGPSRRDRQRVYLHPHGPAVGHICHQDQRRQRHPQLQPTVPVRGHRHHHQLLVAFGVGEPH